MAVLFIKIGTIYCLFIYKILLYLYINKDYVL